MGTNFSPDIFKRQQLEQRLRLEHELLARALAAHQAYLEASNALARFRREHGSIMGHPAGSAALVKVMTDERQAAGRFIQAMDAYTELVNREPRDSRSVHMRSAAHR